MVNHNLAQSRHVAPIAATTALLVLLPDGLAYAGSDNMPTGWGVWIVPELMVLFTIGIAQSVAVYVRTRMTLRGEIDRPKPSRTQVEQVAAAHGRELPFFLILVPARDEAAVITNTIIRLDQLDYPHDRYAVAIICDERECNPEGRLRTQDIVSHMAEEINAKSAQPLLYLVEVPEWFSGRFGDESKTYARSTKGRALNYALGWVKNHPRLSRADIFGVLDADGRLHPQVLCEVAQRRIEHGAKLLQGPVFQISNFPNVDLMGKAAGIELSIYHLSTLSRRLQSGRNLPRFLAGTNYFVDLALMLKVRGWNENALVEDAELGLRLFLTSGVRAEWLSCHEIEQTPPNWKVYLRQRERWALGHYELLPQIRASTLGWRMKAYMQCMILGAVFKIFFDAGLPILGWFALVVGWSAEMPEPLAWAMLGLLAGSTFTWDFFGRGAVMLNRYAPQPLGFRALLALRLLLAIATPYLMIVQVWPRVTGLAKYLSGSHSREWRKTPRTMEALPAPSGQISLIPIPDFQRSREVVLLGKSGAKSLHNRG